jgi:transposase-like protein
MDETYIEVKGQWYYLYRAVDKTEQTIDFLLTEQRGIVNLLPVGMIAWDMGA